MILRPLSIPRQPDSNNGDSKPAWKVFLEIEKQVKPPFAIIFQAEHSELAGRLAKALLPETFGELPPEVIEAAAQHDFGWTASDEAQLHSRNERTPRPFPALSTEETLPSWYDCIAHAKSLGPLGEVMVSRHFTMLATGDESRAEFVRTETERRAAIERTLGYTASDLDRWTGAVGFVDLLSLYLCCGCQDRVEFPIAHPADPCSAQARKTSLFWENGSPRFSPQVLRSGTSVGADVRSYNGTGSALSPLRLRWKFAGGG